MNDWMWGLRQQISLLLSEGHNQAHDYPVGVVWEESQLVVARINGRLATEATIMHQVMMTAVAAFGKDGGRSAHQSFVKMVEGLTKHGA